MLLALWVPVALTVYLIQGFFSSGHSPGGGCNRPPGIEIGPWFSPCRPHCVSWRSWGIFLLLLTTQPGALMSAMTQRGMSPKTVYVVSAALQIAPALTTRAQGILHAQQARGLPVTGLRGRSGPWFRWPGR